MELYIENFFNKLIYFNDAILWGYVGLTMILGSIVYLSFKSRFLQITQIPKILHYFWACRKDSAHCEIGTSPMKVFYAALGGCIGIGNLATVGIAIQIGGPGALFWICMVSLFGSIIKYAEVYLGLKFRVRNSDKGYDGGPMYFLQHAFPRYKVLFPMLVCFFLCVYGVDVYMFTIIKSSFENNFHIPNSIATGGLLLVLVLGVLGGVDRIGRIGSILLPLFLGAYTCMSLWVFITHSDIFPSVLKSVIVSAFTGHAAIGAFVGSSFLLTISKGMSSSVYASDLGVGFASVISAETARNDFPQQAGLVVFGVYLNTFIVCLCSMLLVLVTGVWTKPEVDGGMLVQHALSHSFKNMEYFMPFFLFILGYTSLLSSFMTGVKCAKFISRKRGIVLYYAYALAMFIVFSYFDTYYALIIMTLAGGFLTIINLAGILKLSNEIDYKI